MKLKITLAAGLIAIVCGAVVFKMKPGHEYSRSPAMVDEAKAIAGFDKKCNGCHNDRYVDAASIKRNGAEIYRRMRWISDSETSEPKLIDMPLGANRKSVTNIENDSLATFQAMLAFVRPVAESQVHFDKYPVEKLTLPKGFEISLYATVPGARSMTVTKDGTLFVSTGGFSNPMQRIYRLKDWNGNGTIEPDEVEILIDGLDNPNGVTVHGNSLFVAEQNTLLEFANAVDVPRNTKLSRSNAKPLHTFPAQDRHTWKYLRAAPAPEDGMLYYSVGAPCNACDPTTLKPGQAAIHRIDISGGHDEIMANGVRNSMGFDFRKGKDGLQVWFTDNGRDEMGNDFPPDELNKISKPGEHFGWPHCNGDGVEDTKEFPKEGFCVTTAKPVAKLDPHSAALGMRFYRGTKMPAEFAKNIFIAEHGSWNRGRKSGHQVVTVNPDTGAATPFITGWLDTNTDLTWGRPVDVEELPDGSLLISDDGIPDDGNPEHDKANVLKGAVYRVKFVGP